MIYKDAVDGQRICRGQSSGAGSTVCTGTILKLERTSRCPCIAHVAADIDGLARHTRHYLSQRNSALRDLKGVGADNCLTTSLSDGATAVDGEERRRQCEKSGCLLHRTLYHVLAVAL